MVIPVLLYGTHRPTAAPFGPSQSEREISNQWCVIAGYKQNTASRRPTAQTAGGQWREYWLPTCYIISYCQGFGGTCCLLFQGFLTKLWSQYITSKVGIYTSDYNSPNPSVQHCALLVLYDTQMLQNSDMLKNGVLQILNISVSTVGLSTNFKQWHYPNHLDTTDTKWNIKRLKYLIRLA